MRVRIGGLEFVDPTWDELDEIIARYGAKGGDSPEESEGGAKDGPKKTKKKHDNHGMNHADRAVLEMLVRAANAGVPTQALGEILGRRGKATGRGLQEWAQRVGLASEPNIDPLEQCRVDSRRGARIKPGFLPIAQNLMND